MTSSFVVCHRLVPSRQTARGISSLLIVFVFYASSIAQSQTQNQKQKRTKPKELVALVEPQYDPLNWREFTSKDGGFSMVAPGVPTEEVHQVMTPEGAVTVHSFIVNANAEYGVSYTDFLLRIEDSGRVAEFLNRVRDSGVKGIKGRLLEDKPIEFEGHPGHFYRVEFGENYVMNSKSLVVGNRLYLVTASAYRQQRALAEVVRSYDNFATRFIDSFKLMSPN